MKMLCYLLLMAAASGAAHAAEPAGASAADVLFTVNNLWIMIGAALVFIMHIGFALLESGLARAKNCVNILCKNTVTPAIGLLTYALIGFGLMFPHGYWLCGGFLGFDHLGLECPPGTAGMIGWANGHYTYWSDFLFQGMFAATCVTIVSGAVAGRIKLSAYILFAIFYSALVYPLVGSWGWGGGWLAGLGFHDLAGSTFVHSVGGWGALAGVIMLGPRIGKFVNGISYPIVGHNIPLAVIGTFLLWFGWFGFNGASAFSADPASVSYILVATSLAASAGLMSSLGTSWIIQKKPDLTMVLNGCLAGLVAITAGADCLSLKVAILIGAIAGVLVVLAVMFFDRIRLDDPVGALSVHLVNGVFGTLCVGIFSPDYSFGVQLIGVAAIGAASFCSALAIFAGVKVVLKGLRPSEDAEIRGLDLAEHGMEGYGGFQIFQNQ